MKQRRILAGVVIILLAVITAVFFYPHHMIAPGALMPAHVELQQDCFACHAPLQAFRQSGASPATSPRRSG